MRLATEAMNDPSNRKMCPQSMFEQLVQRKADQLLAKESVRLLDRGWADFASDSKVWTSKQVAAHAKKVLATVRSTLEDELTVYMAGADLGRYKRYCG
jgi:hypothetical protein